MFSKKAIPKKVKVLNEREIQERLYGFYHASDMVGVPKTTGEKEPQASVAVKTEAKPHVSSAMDTLSAPKTTFKSSADLFAEPNETYVPKARVTTPIGLNSSAEKIAIPFEDIWAGLTGQVRKWVKDALFLVKKVPQQYLIMGLVGVVFVVIVFQFFGSKRMPKDLSPSTGLTQSAPALQSPAKEEAVPVPAKKAPVVPAASPLSPVAPVMPPAKMEKIYTVQLCLSDDEGASENLITRLKAKGFEAFSHKIHGGRGTYFQIYVGRYKNSAEAQAAMKKLRMDSEFKMYSDSFVRVTQ